VTPRVHAPARRLALVLAVAAVLVPATGCGADEPTADVGSALRGASADPSVVSSLAGEGLARATLRVPDGAAVGTVELTPVDGGTRVTVAVEDGGEPDAFHGLHVHANDDPANGEGCVADPAAAPADWFTSADGHLPAAGPGAHGGHAGDLPPLLVLADGTAAAETTTDRFAVADVTGAAVVLHAGPDNAGRVPTGTAEDQYTPNALAALDLTHRTGNAGPRIACGVITPT
jgi:Cu-Zn family superoxide dismutase